MSGSGTISVHIKNNFNVKADPVQIEISPDSTVFDLTKTVAKKFLETKDKYDEQFRLVWDHQLLNTNELKNKKISSLGESIDPISNNATIYISFYDSNNINSDVFSWDTLSESEKEKKVLDQKGKFSSKKLAITDNNNNNNNNNKNKNNNKNNNKNKNNNFRNNWPLLRIIIGVIDLLLLAVAIITFLLFFLTSLSVPVAIPIVLTALFVAGAVLFFGWNKILPKILPEGGLKKINSGIDPNENDKEKSKNYEKEEEIVLDQVNEFGNKI